MDEETLELELMEVAALARCALPEHRRRVKRDAPRPFHPAEWRVHLDQERQVLQKVTDYLDRNVPQGGAV